MDKFGPPPNMPPPKLPPPLPPAAAPTNPPSSGPPPVPPKSHSVSQLAAAFSSASPAPASASPASVVSPRHQQQPSIPPTFLPPMPPPPPAKPPSAPPPLPSSPPANINSAPLPPASPPPVPEIKIESRAPPSGGPVNPSTEPMTRERPADPSKKRSVIEIEERVLPESAFPSDSPDFWKRTAAAAQLSYTFARDSVQQIAALSQQTKGPGAALPPQGSTPPLADFAKFVSLYATSFVDGSNPLGPDARRLSAPNAAGGKGAISRLCNLLTQLTEMKNHVDATISKLLVNWESSVAKIEGIKSKQIAYDKMEKEYLQELKRHLAQKGSPDDKELSETDKTLHMKKQYLVLQRFDIDSAVKEYNVAREHMTISPLEEALSVYQEFTQKAAKLFTPGGCGTVPAGGTSPTGAIIEMPDLPGLKDHSQKLHASVEAKVRDNRSLRRALERRLFSEKDTNSAAAAKGTGIRDLDHSQSNPPRANLMSPRAMSSNRLSTAAPPEPEPAPSPAPAQKNWNKEGYL